MASKNTNKANNETKNTQIKGTPNNVGQEITKLEAMDVVVCNMTDEEHKARIERINTKMEQGLRLSWDILVDITSAKERHEQVLDGYDDTTEAFNRWAMELFGMGETQIKQASRVIMFYGSIDNKGEYSLEDKYKRYTKEKLDIIQRIPQLKTKAQFDEVTEALGIMPTTSEGVLKEIVREAKGLPQKEEKSPEEKAKAKEEKAKTMEIAEIKESKVYKEVDKKRDLLMAFVSKYYTEVRKINNAIRDDKDGKKNKENMVTAVSVLASFEREFEEMEKAYGQIGKENK